MLPKQRIVFEFSPEQCEEFLEILRACKELLENPKPAEPVSEFIGIEDVMTLTGYSKSTLYKLSCTDKIPHIRKHRRLLFRRSEILRWLEGGRRGPTLE